MYRQFYSLSLSFSFPLYHHALPREQLKIYNFSGLFALAVKASDVNDKE